LKENVLFSNLSSVYISIMLDNRFGPRVLILASLLKPKFLNLVSVLKF